MTSIALATTKEKEITLASDKRIGSDIYSEHCWHALVAIAKNKPDVAKQILAQENSCSGQEDQSRDTIEAVFDHIFITLVAYDPQLLSSLRLFESINIKKHNTHLINVSPPSLLEMAQRKRECLELLHQYPIETLTPEQQVSYAIFDHLLTQALVGEKFLFHEYRVNHFDGLLFEFILTFTEYHQLQDLEDAHCYCKRLAAIPAYCKQIIELQEHQKGLGILPPVFTIQRVITLIENMINDAVLYTHFAQALREMPGIDQQDLLAQAQMVVSTCVYPALQELGRYYTSLLANHTTNEGVWVLPNGQEYYDYMLARHTTSSLSADEIHALGLQEVERIQQEMRTLFTCMNRNDEDKSVGQLMQELGKCAEFYYPSTPEGKQTCLTDYEKILERCRKELYPLFDHKPTQPVSIQVVPDYLQNDASVAYYLEPSFDGVRPGIFFANLRNMQEVPRYRMETLVVHEAEPGHHFQLALQNEFDIPPARKLGEYNAYVEGWALYTEKLAYEQGFYSSPASQLGHLQDELLRAVRLVVDTGIHKKRWSKERAIEYMTNILGYHYDSVLTEVERYFVLPGQACAYKIGQLTILALRDKAKKQLGPAFDIREFHNVVLGVGASPLCVLEEVVDHYIKRKL